MSASVVTAGKLSTCSSLETLPKLVSRNEGLTQTLDTDMDDTFTDFFPEGFELEAPMFGELDYSTTNFAPINNLSTSNATHVSPRDLQLDPNASAPPSTTFTNNSTPSLFDTVDPAESIYGTSPLQNADSDLFGNTDTGNWFSLFPDDGTVPMNSKLDQSFTNETSTSSASPMARVKSSPGDSPATPGGRGSFNHSSTNGVNPRNSRGKPLPPVQFDPTDPIAAKRARNTEAARKSRQRKMQHVGELEATIADLEAQRDEFKQESEKWKAMFKELHAQRTSPTQKPLTN